MRTLPVAVLVLVACGRHGGGSAAKPAPVAATATSAAPAAPSAAPTEPPSRDATEGMTAHAADVLAPAHGLVNLRIAPTRIWTHGEDVAVAWALAATHATTGRAVGVSGVSVRDRIYVDAATIRAQVEASGARVRARPVLPASPVRFAATAAPDEARNLAVVAAMRNALVSRNAAAFAALLADDVVHDDMTQPETSRGKPEARRFVERLAPAATFELHATWAAGDFVIAESTQRGTDVVTIWRFVDGVVREGATYPDYRSSNAEPARGGPNQ